MNVKLIAYTKGINGESPEKIIELAARTSHKSFSRMEEGSERKLIRHLIKLGHLSVLEHASATFRIKGISRACTHQLVRHRLASFTQESQRYVNEKNFEYIIPPDIQDSDNPEIEIYFNGAMEGLREIYRKLISLGIKKEDARFVLPNATISEIVMSANFREWLHIINLRVSKEAQWEIRELCILCWKELYKIAPTVFNVESFQNTTTKADYDNKEDIFRTKVIRD